MNCKLVKVARKVKTKKGEESTIWDLYLVFENGTKEKILPNSFEGKDKKKISNLRVLLALATDNLPF